MSLLSLLSHPRGLGGGLERVSYLSTYPQWHNFQLRREKAISLCSIHASARGSGLSGHGRCIMRGAAMHWFKRSESESENRSYTKACLSSWQLNITIYKFIITKKKRQKNPVCLYDYSCQTHTHIGGAVFIATQSQELTFITPQSFFNSFQALPTAGVFVLAASARR